MITSILLPRKVTGTSQWPGQSPARHQRLMERRMRFTSTVRSGSLHVSCLLVLLLAQCLPALADDRPWMGMDIVDCRIESRFLGVAVLRIEEDSPARDAGILA